MIDESDKGGSDGLVQLSSTLRTLSTLTSDPGDVVPEELAEGWRQVSQLLNEADCKVSDLLAVTRAAQQERMDEQLLHSTLQGWNRQLLALKSGACALLPLAWSTSVSSRHAVLVVLRRRGDYGTLALVNLAGSGSEYHPQQLSDCATRPWRQISPVTCSSIPWSRLSSTVFWLFMLRPLVTGLALDEPHPALLYEALLPFLTKKDGEFFDGNLSMRML
ncbi:unnamed protein product [Cladocopium goreaui]|uniref:C3H1-type domain-containing protein n=1 Tax=Cladocopium goreaui TaxID=2562237 RepID=A0A9P1FTT9_9DINO|nr:unnamed protein product [Cladocopium goreaui]